MTAHMMMAALAAGNSGSGNLIYGEDIFPYRDISTGYILLLQSELFQRVSHLPSPNVSGARHT